YETASETQKENLQEEENAQCGAGDESVGTESDNNFSGQFSFTDSLTAINKLKNIGQMIPPGMEQGMSSNKPY
ncbi:5614_t:CDS:2, partial [Funneliformis geosporum]